ncbi:hypothetical protein [Serratia fonticola]|uniref:hypothetical protein n=1 Tax=Serratia fonticola TaxID=47917 RepID=UPI002177E478|nr:hypothetical protein [Serratia fonticola]CAI1589946.1 Uncharacterised protein [Serratia fonticola]CAI1908263.1 Uncharacterised protein [Serratia fonticola]CAI1923326.1 Uncharacterised protein [Serratia fonticola]
MATYFVDKIICSKDCGDSFTEGSVYDLLEQDGLYCVENDEGRLIEAFHGKTNVCAANSHFDYFIE